MKKISERRENYLKRIYELSKTCDVRGVDLARELGVSKPTVCVYLKRLVEYGDITMDAQHTVHLTAQGHEIAEQICGKHSMLTQLLLCLGVPKPIAIADACAIEHNLSPESYEALKLLLEERQNAV